MHYTPSGSAAAPVADLYRVLGVARDASDDQLKKAFRTAALRTHPDRGGSNEAFQQVNEANEVLSDPTKRRVYDNEGQAGLDRLRQGGGAGGGGVGEMLRRQQQQQLRTQDIHIGINLSMRELFTGCQRKLRISRQVLCVECKGMGGKGTPTVCEPCLGRGATVEKRSIAGMGMMMQQVQVRCSHCAGLGKTFPKAQQCTGVCGGRPGKTSKSSSEISVEIRPGMMQGDTIVKKGMSEECFNATTGDLVIVVEEVENDADAASPSFKRDGDHLFMTREISLVDALTGCSFEVESISGGRRCGGGSVEKDTAAPPILLWLSTHGNIVSPGSFFVVRGEGMPRNENQHLRGDLFIEFSIVFPEHVSFSADTRETLTRLFSTPPTNPPLAPTRSDAADVVSSDPAAASVDSTAIEPATTTAEIHPTVVETTTNPPREVTHLLEAIADISLERSRHTAERVRRREADSQSEFNSGTPEGGNVGCRQQ